MVSEVGFGVADSSAAGVAANIERHELVDFSPSIVLAEGGLVIKTPQKSEQVSFLDRKLILW